MKKTQIAIIGAGPAGLQAAMSAGRVHRQALVFDSGEYRNAPVSHMHNVAGFDGTPPGDFRAIARQQLDEYPTVELTRDTVSGVMKSDDGFMLETSSGPVQAQTLILATGMRDILPDIPGLNALWGTRAAQCLFCHGHEYAGKRLALLGANEAGHYAAMLRPITSNLVALTNGEDLPETVAPVVQKYGADVRLERIVGVEADGSGVRINFAEGEPLLADGLFLLPQLTQRSDFADQLGLAMHDSGAVVVDEWQRTSVDGVFAAGDMAHTAAFPVPMASVVQGMASGQMAATSAIQALMLRD